MFAGRYVFATTAFCALSTSLASAAHHHGLHSNGSASANASGSGAVDHINDGNGSGVAGADNTDKSAADQFGRRSKKPPATGASSGPETGVGPDNATGRNQAIRPVPGSVNENDIHAPIDTRITVNQGHAPHDARRNRNGRDVGAAIADISKRLGGKIGLTAVPKTPGHPAHSHDQQPKFPPKGIGSVARNAIGAIIEHHVDVQHGSASPVRSARQGPGAQGLGGIASGATVQPEPGGGSTKNSSLGAPQNGHPDPGAHAIVVPSVHGPSINGTNMIRPGAGPVSLGGPAKVAAGVINGTDFRTRHP